MTDRVISLEHRRAATPDTTPHYAVVRPDVATRVAPPAGARRTIGLADVYSPADGAIGPQIGAHEPAGIHDECDVRRAALEALLAESRHDADRNAQIGADLRGALYAARAELAATRDQLAALRAAVLEVAASAGTAS